MDSETLNNAEADLVSAFFSEVLSFESDISDGKEVKAAAKVFKEERAALLARNDPVCEKVRWGWMLHRYPSDCGICFYYSMFESCSFYGICSRLLLDMWSLVWRSWLHSSDPEALLATGWGPLKVLIRPSAMCHEKTSRGLLDLQNYRKV